MSNSSFILMSKAEVKLSYAASNNASVILLVCATTRGAVAACAEGTLDLYFLLEALHVPLIALS